MMYFVLLHIYTIYNIWFILFVQLFLPFSKFSLFVCMTIAVCVNVSMSRTLFTRFTRILLLWKWVCVHLIPLFTHLHTKESISLWLRKKVHTTNCIFHYIWPVTTDICFDREKITQPKKTTSVLAFTIMKGHNNFCIILIFIARRPYFWFLMIIMIWCLLFFLKPTLI